jgi:hypothetical protein
MVEKGDYGQPRVEIDQMLGIQFVVVALNRVPD